MPYDLNSLYVALDEQFMITLCLYLLNEMELHGDAAVYTC